MAKAWLEDKATWLFDLAHDNLDEDAIVKGFLKHYALQGQGMGDVQRDMHFRTHYGDFYLKAAMAYLRRALEAQIEAVLDEGGIFYGKGETWIDSEKLYEVLYEMEVSA